MSASIGDVAERAGVSVATVSRAIRGLPNVAPRTRTRVLRAAEELQYVAHPHASRLAAGRTMTVGMAVPLLTQWFFNQVVAGAEAVLAGRGYDVLLYSLPDVDAKTRFLERLPFSKRVDGLIAVDLPLSPGEVRRLSSAGTPLVTVGTASHAARSVGVDNVSAAVTATRHLIALGHRRIGLISHLVPQSLAYRSPIDRRAGYERALAEAGIPLCEELIVPGNFALQGGADAMAQLLSLARPPTAVFAMSDEMALGALKVARDAGCRVPGDLSIIGFDDHDLAAFTDLTTVAQPVHRQGETAATLLLDDMVRAGLQREAGRLRVDGRSPDRPSVVMPTTMVVRGTTGPAPAAVG